MQTFKYIYQMHNFHLYRFLLFECKNLSRKREREASHLHAFDYNNKIKIIKSNV